MQRLEKVGGLKKITKIGDFIKEEIVNLKAGGKQREIILATESSSDALELLKKIAKAVKTDNVLLQLKQNRVNIDGWHTVKAFDKHRVNSGMYNDSIVSRSNEMYRVY